MTENVSEHEMLIKKLLEKYVMFPIKTGKFRNNSVCSEIEIFHILRDWKRIPDAHIVLNKNKRIICFEIEVSHPLDRIKLQDYIKLYNQCSQYNWEILLYVITSKETYSIDVKLLQKAFCKTEISCGNWFKIKNSNFEEDEINILSFLKDLKERFESLPDIQLESDGNLLILNIPKRKSKILFYEDFSSGKNSGVLKIKFL